jgi:hypothetical protein
METIFNQVLSQAIGIVAGSLGTIFFGGIALWAYVQIGGQKLVKEKPAVIINMIALLVRKYLLLWVKDRNFTDQVLVDLDCSGDKFNDYWDSGLKGVRLYD